MISYKKIDGKHCVVDEKGKTIAVCTTKKAAMFFVDMESAYYEAVDACMTPIMYYFECDLDDSDDGYSRKQQGIVYAGSEQALYWAIDEILDPCDVRITNNFHMNTAFVVGWEFHKSSDDCRRELDYSDNIQINDNALWFKFDPKEETLSQKLVLIEE